MTVRELIEQLSALDPDAPVLVYEPGWEGLPMGRPPNHYRDAARVKTVQVATRQPGGLWTRFSYWTERNTTTGVTLE